MTNMSKTSAGLLLIIAAAIAIVLVFGTPGGRSTPAFPGLVPIFGWPFGVVFILIQILVNTKLGSQRGWVWMTVTWFIIIPITLLAEPIRSEAALNGLDRVVTGAAVASALVLGWGLFKHKL